jgi:hypothetical protein
LSLKAVNVVLELNAVSSLNRSATFSSQNYGLFHSRNVYRSLILNLQPMEQGWTTYEANSKKKQICRNLDFDENEMFFGYLLQIPFLLPIV